MIQTLTIALGGAAGAVLRYWTSSGVYALTGRDFPYGTLVVNVLGSLAMGVLVVLMVEREGVPPELRAGILVGLLGAFTTFSTFSFETLALLEQGRLLAVFGNVGLSVITCIGACWLGVVVTRALT